MTRYFIPGVDKDYILSRSKYAQFLHITVNCLKLRMRRGMYGTEYVIDNGKYLFRLPKGNGDLHVPNPAAEPSNEPINPGPKVHVSNNGSAHDTGTASLSTQIKNHYNRGATHKGKTNYHPNMSGLKKANDIKALNKIRNNLGDEYTDEINDEVVMIARRNVAAKKEVLKKIKLNKKLDLNFLDKKNSFLKVLSFSEFVITSPSTTFLECCYLKIPTILFQTSKNQVHNFLYAKRHFLFFAYNDINNFKKNIKKNITYITSVSYLKVFNKLINAMKLSSKKNLLIKKIVNS